MYIECGFFRKVSCKLSLILSNSFAGSYSRVTMQLVLQRKITYHLFRTYLPSGLFVIIGWFSLFIPLDHVPGRVTMGMTTLLTLAAMFSAIATTTPRVSYSSKLDVWMVFCVIFVFGTLLEFTLLIFLQKQVFATRLKRSYTEGNYRTKTCRGSASSNTFVDADSTNNGGESRIMLTTLNDCRSGHGSGRRRRFDALSHNSGAKVTLQPLPTQIGNPVRRDISTDTIEPIGTGSEIDYDGLVAEEERQREILFRIERYGIVAFAIFFVVFNVFYWLHLLHFQFF